MNKTISKKNSSFLNPKSVKWLLFLNIVFLVIYYYVIIFWFEPSNYFLFFVLIFGQTFYFWQCLSYIYTIWNTDHKARKDLNFLPIVDVFITVAGEPCSIVEKTLSAIMKNKYPDFKVYILNDGFVAKKENWREIESLAVKYGAIPITRKIGGGFKAGNINNALKKTKSPFVVILDADHIPNNDFLQKIMPYFVDEKVAFVQTPQYYENNSRNIITSSAWDQQQLFFGAICMGKNRLNSVTMAGTNMAIRRKALEDVGGMCDYNIAEDFITGMFIHQKGWKSVYVPEILTKGLAPEDFASYYKQQFRWTKGSLEVFINYNPLFRKGLDLRQKLQYLSSSGYYLSGLIIFLNSLLPLIFFFTEAVPFTTNTMFLVIVFLPYMIITLFNLQLISNKTYTFNSLSFSMSSWFIHLTALIEVLLRKKSSFKVTSKIKLEGNFLRLVIPHIVYMILTIIGVVFYYIKNGLTPSLVTNVSWSLMYIFIFMPFVRASFSFDFSKIKNLNFGKKTPKAFFFSKI